MNEHSNILIQLLLILLLIFVNAFFAASEMAIVSVKRNRLQHLSNEGNSKASLLLKLIEEPSKFLATIQVGITLAGFFASASAAVSISEVLADILRDLNIPFLTAISGQLSLILVTIFLAYLTLVLGELVPKRFALQNAEKIALFAVKPIVWISKIAAPFVKILTFSTNSILKLLGLYQENTEEKVTEEEIRMMINVGEENGVFNETEKEMLDGIFEFDDTIAREVMTPRTNIFAMEIHTPLEKIIDTVLDEQHSRIPIYDNSMDNIVGILYLRDLFTCLRKRNTDFVIQELIRPAYFIPETKNIDVLFRELQRSKNHMAILIDEYGAVSGLITMEDLLEEIVGNIFDEYDIDEHLDSIKKIESNTYLVGGLVNIHDLNDHLHIKIPDEHYDTIGGFVIDLMGKIPKENDLHQLIHYDTVSFKIEKIGKKRVELVKIILHAPS